MTEHTDPADRAHDTPDDAPAAGIKPGRARRRRTASMKVSRPSPPQPPGRAKPGKAEAGKDQAEAAPRRGLLTGPAMDRLRDFLDSPAGVALLIGTAIAAALLGPLAIYSVFALAFLVRRPLRRAVARVPLGPRTTVGILIVLVGLLREVLVWTAEYLQGDATTALWHPQLGPDLLFNLGVYAAWGIGWGVALVWFRYRLAEAVVLQAVFGLVVENFGQSLLAAIVTLPAGLLLLAYAMILSGSTVGLAWLLAGDKLRELPGPGTHNAYRLAAPALGTMLATFAIFLFWPRLLEWLGAWPAPGPVRERPFW
ncbi:MAG: hypothetical protein ACRDT4_09175 [Micromonosporaceae bacterium]